MRSSTRTIGRCDGFRSLAFAPTILGQSPTCSQRPIRSGWPTAIGNPRLDGSRELPACDASRYADTFERLRVVTPIDPDAADIRVRRDILAQYHERLKEEAPYAYKDITPVVRDRGILAITD